MARLLPLLAALALMMHPATASAGTVLSTTGCVSGAAGVTDFGATAAGTSAVTTSDCRVGFGSPTGTSMLRLYQQDRRGAALWRPATGALDGSFGSGGKVTTAVPTVVDNDNDVVVQPDGKLVTTGSVACTSGGNCDIVVVRYNADGALDATFGTGGIVTTAVGTGDDRGFAIALQPDGRILVAGRTFASSMDFVLVRYTAGGGLDTSFGSGGRVTTDFAGSVDEASAVAVQPDGRIVVAGNAYVSGNDRFAIARYTSSGAVDTSFGGGSGRTSIDIGPANDKAYGVALQPDGRIVLAGNANATGGNDFAVARLNADGSLDTGFGTSGTVTTAIGAGEETSLDVEVQADGRIVAVGYSHNGSNYDVALTRYDTNGALDTSFGTGGRVRTDVAAGHDYGGALTVLQDGRLIVAAQVTAPGGGLDGAAIRYTSAGAPDAGFGTGGIARIPIGTGDDDLDNIAQQSDGKLVLAGTAMNAGVRELAIVQLDALAIGDYAPGVRDWSTGDGAFGACLRRIAGSGVTAGATVSGWTVDANNDCTASTSDPWRPISAGATASEGGKVAASTIAGVTDAVADLRFGIKLPAAQPRGQYQAPVVIEVVSPNINPPANTVAPSVNGTPQEGRTLTAVDGSWDGLGLTMQYQWRRCDASGGNCADVVGATRRYYVPAAWDIDSTFRVLVTARNGEGVASATSAATTLVVPAAPGIGLSAHVRKDGPAAYWRLGEGSGSTAADSSGNGNHGTYSGTGTTLGSAGAVGNDPDTSISLDGNGFIPATVPQVDSREGMVNTVELWMWWDSSLNDSMPFGFNRYAGYHQFGAFGFNTANSDSYGRSSSGLSGRWVHTVLQFRNGSAQQSRMWIDGVEQTLSQVAGSPVARDATTDVQISGWPMNTNHRFRGRLDEVALYTRALTGQEVQDHYAARNDARPVVSGTAREGSTVTATTGTWTSSRPVTHGYQWQRCSAAGTSCTNIAGATSSSYLLATADVDSRIRVTVTGTNAGGSTAVSSLPVIVGEGYRTTTLDDAPVGYWRLGEASGTAAADASDSGNAGSYVGTHTKGAAGALLGSSDTATSLDGSSGHVTVPNSSSLNVTGRVTVEAWVRAASASPTAHKVIVWKGASSGADATTPYSLSWLTTNRFYFNVGGGGSSAQSLTSTATLSAGRWYHVVGTADGSTMRLYIDGALDSSQAQTVTPAASTSALTIGGLPGAGANQYFHGSIDEVAVYDRALSGTRIAQRYRASLTAVAPRLAPDLAQAPTITGTLREGQVAGSTPGRWAGTPTHTYGYQWQRCNSYASGVMASTPAAYWRLGEPRGAVAHDETANGNHGSYSSGGVTYATSGAVASAIDPDTSVQFGSGGAVDVSIPQVNTTAGAVNTVEFWMYWNGSENVMPFGFDRYDLWFLSGHFGFNTGNSDIYGISSAGLANRWVHVAAQFSNGSITSNQLFIDGVAQSLTQRLATPVSRSATTTARISGWTSDSGYSFNGRIDDLAVFNRAVGAAEINAHIDAGSATGGSGCSDISGATSSTHTATSADIGRRLRLRITATNPVGTSSALSLPSAVVVAITPANTGAASISGMARIGRTLTASPGTWTSSQPVKYLYQWRRCDSAGANCVDIGGAIRATYVPVDADVGRTLRVVVTAFNSGGPANSTSAQTGIVDGLATLAFTGSSQSWTVPAGVTSITVEVDGAAGGNGIAAGGRGGRVQATLSVSAGEALTVLVGGQGQGTQCTATRSAGGYNGGGIGGLCPGGGNAGGAGGGGASTILRSGTRLAVGGGGGGAGAWGWNGEEGGPGGAGGGPGGANGANGLNRSGMTYGFGWGGSGATQSGVGAGGAANSGCGGGGAGTAGSGSTGGQGGDSLQTYAGGAGGGGGGYFGGGGGTGACNGGGGGGGGGGSSWTSGTSVTYTSGVRSGNGSVTIRWP